MLKSRGNLMQGVGQRLRTLRKQLNFSANEMAGRLGIRNTSYYKNESGETVPSMLSLQRLHKDIGISMDWLLFNSGPMYYKTKEAELKKLEEKKAPGLEELVPAEEKELLEHMGKDSVFRHRVLLYFHKYKKTNKE